MRSVLARLAPISLLGAALLYASASPAIVLPPSPDALGLGGTTFWEGATIATVKVPDDSACDTVGPCPSWPLTVGPGGKRLRVAIDTPRRSDDFVLEVIDPLGTMTTAETSNQFNAEALIANPAPGLWTVRVRPNDVTDANFRLRAKLETVLIPEERPMPLVRTALLPNLRTVPPFEFTFTAPANPANGVYPPDTVNPPLDVAGVHPVSCTADESAPVSAGGGGAKKCLRFTSGPMNLGPGIYDMRFSMIDDLAAGKASPNPAEAFSRVIVGPMFQVIYYSDGTSEQVPAGTYSFHPVHGHFHDDYVLGFELYRVTDAANGTYVHVGNGTKSGFCPADQLFAEWWKFYQGGGHPGGDSGVGNCMSPQNGVIGLTLGWGDVYRWQRPGMYVEFDGQPNGRYVVQSIVDPKNHVQEADDSDNISYAYVQIDGDRIQLLERGWGTSPWDPKKTVFSGDGPAQHEPGPDAEMSASKADKPAADSKGLVLASGAVSPAALLALSLAVAARRRRRS